MNRLLTDRQAEELHKAIVAYLTANELPNTTATLRTELNLTEEAFDSTTIMDLEARNTALQSELDNATPTSLFKRDHDPVSWLPTTARYSLESHRNTINCVAFHPSFSSIASGSDDCTVKIWDWELGELERTLKGHTRPVLDADFGGPRGGTLLASCSSDLSIKLWNPADEYKNVRTLLGHDHIVSAVRFIPSGNLLISASRDADLRVWDVTTGYCVKTISGHTEWVRDICLSADARFLLSTGNDRTARLWDITNTLQPDHKLTMVGHEHVVECCAIAPQTSYQNLAQLAGLKKLSSSGSAEFMATGSRDKTIKLWDARGTCFMTLVGHDGWVHAIVFHPGGRYLLSVSDDKTLRCWDLSREGRCVKTLRDIHESFVGCMRWAPGVVKHAPVLDSNAEGKNKKSKNEDGVPDVEIRCVIATGGWDSKLNIFAH
ncbi:protein with putative role during mitosis [Aspergillus nanangensis]|uniref:Nuclear distribution protein nudF n=1 Tax=Aspergillus nanangensis TaxID=2582783 RepID=A0AAD4CQD5_ASPNN|nr:protein with putative role during mitosis [Aspergillus nanangensis]